MKTTKNKWICTDSDMSQYGRKIADGIYEFKQKMKYPDGSVINEKATITLADYTDAEIEDHLSPYGWSIEQLKVDCNNEDALWLMAECIFEQTV